MPLYKKILLINPPFESGTINRDMAGGLGYEAGEGVVIPPLDLALLAVRLKNTGHKVWFVDAMAENKTKDEVWRLIKKYNIDLVIGLLALPTIEEDIKFYKFLKDKNLEVIVKTGINYKEILKKITKESGVDKIIFGEPELKIDKILRTKEKIIDAGRIDNINKLPIAPRQLFKHKFYRYLLLPRGLMTTMQTSRGCPFACGSYCPYPLVQGKTWRFMNPQRVIREINSVIKLGIKNILFRDATFTLDKKRTIDICKMISNKKIKINWWCETRANVLDKEIMRAMKKAGCRGINLGVESLDSNIIKDQGKPGVDINMIKQVRQWGKQLGIKLHFLMIIGLPSETPKTIYQTFKVLKQLRPESIGFSLITPYPGTQLFEQAVKKKLITNFNWNNFNGSQCNMRTEKMSVAELSLARLGLMATSYFLKRPKIVSFVPLAFIDVIFRIWQLRK